MATVVSGLLVIIASLLSASIAVFFVEVLAAVVFPQKHRSVYPSGAARQRVAVLVPAHNESVGVLPTLVDIQSQLRPGDRLLVVADNCTDDTAAVARARGAEVVERHDRSRHGKGYALDWGVRHLSSDPPEIILIVDADCRLAEGVIDELALTCTMTGKPIQALYLMTPPIESKLNNQVAQFAWRVKNWLRPLGLRVLDLPCQLMGTGMAFPWSLIRSANLRSGHLVEDLKLGLDLALAGHPPMFCPSAQVTSQFASSPMGAGTQRKRWEQGQIHTILNTAPRLLITALAGRRWDLLALALDLVVPPLSLLAILILGVLMLSGFTAFFNYPTTAFIIAAAGTLIFMFAVFLAWLKCGRDVLPVTALVLIPLYVFRKLNIYWEFVFGKMDSRWNRTDRSK